MMSILKEQEGTIMKKKVLYEGPVDLHSVGLTSEKR